jgi:HAMP domain-containing protein
MLFLLFFLFLSLILNVVAGIGIVRALRKSEEITAFFDAMQQRLTGTIELMRQIDIRGSFESDDEVGGVFQQLKAMVEALDVFLVTEADADAEKK